MSAQWVEQDILADNSGALASALVPIDVNGDGLTDFILVQTSAGGGIGAAVSPVVFVQGPSGTFTDATSAVFQTGVPTAVSVQSFTVGDFNNDGRPDVVLADEGPDRNPWPGGKTLRGPLRCGR